MTTTTAHLESLASRFDQVRSTTLALTGGLSPEDLQVQSMTEASPGKWHLGHTTWFFETFVLERQKGFSPFRPEFRVLFNSYYALVGDRPPRPERGLLTRPSLEEVLEYRQSVDQRLTTWLYEDFPATLAPVLELGLNHEQQHQELLLMDLKHAFGCNPLAPALLGGDPPDATPAVAQRWHHFDGGTFPIGHDGNGFAYDNEGPRHEQIVPAFELAHRLTTNREWLEFVEDGGYRKSTLWLSDGWDWRLENGIDAPSTWRKENDGWTQFTLHGRERLREDDPVTHLSYYEAEAFARWSDARLPTEAEWERAATGRAIRGNLLGNSSWHPRPATDEGEGPAQLFGDAWEWTQSPYSAYPGYRIAEGAVGEYNGKFMANQFVLRGGSFATPADHIRATYRNFFHPQTRWHFSAVRLARDAG